jgi:hypothetical protein
LRVMCKFFLTGLSKNKELNEIKASDLPGTHVKSFAIHFAGTEIWIEHLDGMYSFTDDVMRKFADDVLSIIRPSAPSLIAVNLDETVVTEELTALIAETFSNYSERIRKIVFVGLNRRSQKLFRRAFEKRADEYQFAVNYINDFEKAKEWLAGKR